MIEIVDSSLNAGTIIEILLIIICIFIGVKNYLKNQFR